MPSKVMRGQAQDAPAEISPGVTWASGLQLTNLRTITPNIFGYHFIWLKFLVLIPQFTKRTKPSELPLPNETYFCVTLNCLPSIHITIHITKTIHKYHRLVSGAGPNPEKFIIIQTNHDTLCHELSQQTVSLKH